MSVQYFAADYAYGINPSVPSVIVQDGGNAAGASGILITHQNTVSGPAGRIFYPFNTNAKVNIDTDTAVTVSAVSTDYSTELTSITVTTPTHAHGKGSNISSGTAGLQEAINDVITRSVTGMIIVDGTWTQFGGTTAMITGATGTTAVGIVDWRGGTEVLYVWNGSAYAAKTVDSVTVTTAAPGTVRVIQGSITTSNSSYNNPNNSLVGVRGDATMPVGTTVAAGYVYGTQGKYIMRGTMAGTAWVFGLVGQLDVDTSTLTSGSHLAPIWGDFGATAPAVTASFANLLVLTNTTACTTGSAVYIYSKSSVCFDLNSNGSAMLDASSTAGGSVIGHILVTINGVAGVLRVYNGS